MITARPPCAVLNAWVVVQELQGLADWQQPQAGMFMWLHLPAVADTDDIAAQLVEQNVMVLPGQLSSAFTHCHSELIAVSRCCK